MNLYSITATHMWGCERNTVLGQSEKHFKRSQHGHGYALSQSDESQYGNKTVESLRLFSGGLMALE